ncbi:hypothetical protein OJ920_11025, partial [Streptococcus anginosus]|nr:hypothetical protein [Streptococcus anginosus]
MMIRGPSMKLDQTHSSGRNEGGTSKTVEFDFNEIVIIHSNGSSIVEHATIAHAYHITARPGRFFKCVRRGFFATLVT